MHGQKVYIRNDYWKVSSSFKKPKYYTGKVTSQKSFLDVQGNVVWMVDIDGWGHYEIHENELARSLKELDMIEKEVKKKEKEKLEKYGREYVKTQEREIELYSDPTWNGGCEIVNATGERKDRLCNGAFFTLKNKLRICRLHLSNYIDVTGDESEYEEGEDDEVEFSDDDFIGEEDDGTKIINGKVYKVLQKDEIQNEDDEEEEEEEIKQKRGKRKRYQVVISDSESDDEDEKEETQQQKRCRLM